MMHAWDSERVMKYVSWDESHKLASSYHFREEDENTTQSNISSTSVLNP